MAQLWTVLTLALVLATFVQSRVAERDVPAESENYTLASENYTVIGPDCFTPLDECFAPFRTYHLDTQEEVRSIIGNREALQQMAVDLRTGATCLRDETSSPECQHLYAEDITMFSFIADYLESSGGIDHMVAMLSSPCLADTTRYDQIFAVFINCRAVNESPERNHSCVEYTDFSRCLAQGASFVCGRAAAEFIEDVMEFAAGLENGQDAIDIVLASVNFCKNDRGRLVTRRHVKEIWTSFLEKFRK
ncbi:hypothetical protein ElyMa_004006500 [Elysia marginata]|uniref:DUF19 domain-containing protein n=1 Tax=Elysia marginata TaxID=1093978 RepID=A0AAV4G023_9GAST|nr:hypothetical protein ElyMa_004006500 [Elysia marginata]